MILELEWISAILCFDTYRDVMSSWRQSKNALFFWYWYTSEKIIHLFKCIIISRWHNQTRSFINHIIFSMYQMQCRVRRKIIPFYWYTNWSYYIIYFETRICGLVLFLAIYYKRAVSNTLNKELWEYDKKIRHLSFVKNNLWTLEYFTTL